MGAKVIECVENCEIIVKKVRNQIHCISPHLINYEKLIRDLTNSFLAFNIKLVPRSQNFDADILANTASRLIPPEGLYFDTFQLN